MTTSVLSSLKVIARPKIEPKPPVLGKRLKLIEKLEQQKEMAVCMIENRRFEAFRDKKVKNPDFVYFLTFLKKFWANFFLIFS